ncbi:MAG: OmpA family protein [Candidatus Eisenbacteria bacterium]|nr:OmpA family protein [Candidatus Eisenbacteria bacterium]
MSFFKGALLSAAVALALSAPASAQIAGRPIEVSGTAGGFIPDGRARMQSGFASQGTLGWRLSPAFTLEARGTFGPSHADTTPNQKHNFTNLALDLRWNFRAAESHTVPYLATGFGYGLSHTTGHAPDKLERGAPSVALGVLQNVINQRTYLKLEMRDVMFREREALEFSNHIFATAGLQYVFGGKPHDSDLDGVRDWLDQCPNTPIGAKVDVHGCPIDSDGDGVFDGLDKCANTPKGCTIDKQGCPIDSDGDGVCDGIDTCPNTPKGATVDAKGCPSDADGDGVLDGLDRCPNTAKGCTIDAYGCSKDTDQDGVCDGVDLCANTPAGLRVDAAGCPIEVSVLETQLLDTGDIRLQNIEFDTDSATIRPASFALLDSVGRILVQYPTLRVEVGGHTDDRGKKEHNQQLSEARAAAVMGYLEAKFPLIDAGQYTSKGYGMTSPIAPNTSPLGRARNRRVEFKVLNTQALKIEREHRQFLRKEEAAPADTTKH